jgi:hypothetical protein
MKRPEEIVIERQRSNPRPAQQVSQLPTLTHGKSMLNATTTIHWSVPIVIVAVFVLICVLCAVFGAHVQPAQ